MGARHNLEVYESPTDDGTAWYWRKTSARNGKIVAQGEGYTTRRDGLLGAFRANPDQVSATCQPIGGDPYRVPRDLYGPELSED